jgi:NTP pyrophosphatase (non-canonical NTP hydrolase)
MELKELQERAMQIREKFGDYEEGQVGKRWTRQDISLGFVGDVGDLAKLVMAMEGLRHIENKEEKLAHELADCLWSVLVLAKMYEVDIEAVFRKTMDELELILEEKMKASKND